MTATGFALDGRRQRIIALAAISYVVLFVLSLLLQVRMNGHAAIFTPYSPDDTVVRYLAATTRGGPAYGAFFQAASALALLIFVAQAADQMRRLVPDSGLASVIRSAGTASVTLLLISAAAQWVLNRPSTGSDLRVYRAVSDIVFVTGAAPHVATLGLLVGALSGAGVLRRWLSWFGFAIAGASLVSLLSLLWEPATLFIPIGRYIGMVWFLAVAVSLLRRRLGPVAGRTPLVAGVS